VKNFLFLSVLLFSVPSFAFKEVPALEQDLFLLKVQSTVIQNNELISQAVTQDLAEVFSSKPELITDEDPSRLIEVLEQEFQKQLSTGARVKIVEEFKEKIHELVAEGRFIIRTQGIGLGVMYISMELGNFIVAAALVSAGHPDLAIAIGAIHYHEFLIMGKVALSKLIKIRKTHLAFSKNSTNKSLKHFLKKGGLKHDEKIVGILDESADADDWVKIAFIVNHLRKSEPEAFEALKEQFPNSMIEIEPFQISESLKQWSLMGLSSENQEDFIYFSTHVPADIRVIDAIKVWSKCLYPNMLEESKHLGYLSYRYMVKHLSELDIAAEVHFQELWSADWTARFSRYFMTAFQR